MVGVKRQEAYGFQRLTIMVSETSTVEENVSDLVLEATKVIHLLLSLQTRTFAELLRTRAQAL